MQCLTNRLKIKGDAALSDVSTGLILDTIVYSFLGMDILFYFFFYHKVVVVLPVSLTLHQSL